MSSEEIARILYEAYSNHTVGRSAVTGDALPHWVDVKQPVKDAWIATAIAAANLFLP